MKLTELLNEIEILDKEATKGPWTYDAYVGTDDHDDPDLPVVEPVVKKPDGYDIRIYVPSEYGNTSDAEFIALARTALPLLAQYVKRYREALEKIMENETEICDHCPGYWEAEEALEWTPEGK